MRFHVKTRHWRKIAVREGPEEPLYDAMHQKEKEPRSTGAQAAAAYVFPINPCCSLPVSCNIETKAYKLHNLTKIEFR